jgi:hypothetical protein
LKLGAAGKSPGEQARKGGGVLACRSIILAEPGAARFVGIAAFRSLLPKEAGFGTYLEAGAAVSVLVPSPAKLPLSRRSVVGKPLLLPGLGKAMKTVTLALAFFVLAACEDGSTRPNLNIVEQQCGVLIALSMQAGPACERPGLGSMTAILGCGTNTLLLATSWLSE